MPAVLRPLAENMLDLDGADHGRLRRLVQQGFTPRRVEALRDRVEALCAVLLDTAAARARAGARRRPHRAPPLGTGLADAAGMMRWRMTSQIRSICAVIAAAISDPRIQGGA
jgi:hypothetical protein